MKIFFRNYWPMLKKSKEENDKPCGFCNFPFLLAHIGSGCDGKFHIDIALIGLELNIILG